MTDNDLKIMNIIDMIQDKFWERDEFNQLILAKTKPETIHEMIILSLLSCILMLKVYIEKQEFFTNFKFY